VAVSTKDGSGVDHLRSYLGQQVAEIERTEPIVRLHADDEEAVHDLRVALRRSRSVLGTTKELFEEDWVSKLRDELRWLAGELAPARDLDVLRAYLAEEAPELTKLFDAARQRAHTRAVEALESARYLDLLAALKRTEPGEADAPLRELAGGEFKKLVKSLEALGDEPSNESLHKARIHAKKARYAAELAEPTVGKPAAKLVSSLKRLQDALGAHQDAVVAESMIREAANSTNGSDTAFVAGEIAERQKDRREQALKAIPGAWKKLAKQGRKTWA
jgi:CHAD domain-containing protein